MAYSPFSSSSSAFNVPLIKHDVFLSFRGTDVRTSFLSHLTKDLHRNQIDFFVDDEKLHPGDEISPTLLRAIEQSYISLVIFSEHYASSRWCMEELVKIIECMEQYKRIVIPVFYNIDPSHVRHQKGIFAEAFDVHKERYEEEIMQSWKSVLKKTANLSGIHYPSKYRNESELIQDIVKNISEKLSHLFSNAPHDLVGIDEHFKFLQPLMAMESDEVRTVGIWGMGGIGKTTIARAIFDRYGSRYEGCCFLENVREESQKSGKHSLYEKLISELLEGGHLVKGSAHERSMSVKRRLSRKKVLIVLDDVDALDKLDYLTREPICLGAGSRVIVTTRDEQILIAKGVDKRYKVWGLSFDSSLELFCLKAFHKSCPENGYRELSKMAVNYTKGNPLALKVLGSFLHSRSIKEWESALKKLKVHPNENIYNVLKLSYDGLDDSDKNIFLDIAFFFRGENKDNVIRFLDSCGFYGDIGISTLQRKALITIFGNKIGMHDLIQQMGWEVVRQESNKDPAKLARINKPEDFCNLLKNSEEKSLVGGILIDMSQTKNIRLNANTFRNMPRLRFLKLYTPPFERSWNLFVPTTLETFSDELRYLEWHQYPLSSMPSAFCAENLIEFHMPGSQVTKLWDGVQDLVNLKKLNLWKCEQLVKIPDLSKATNLKWIDISYCKSVVELHPSILSVPKLEQFSSSSCTELKSFKGDIRSKSLKTLNFNGCSSLEEFSVLSGELSSLTFESCRLRNLPNELCCLISLEVLHLYECQELIELPRNLKALSRLKRLKVRSCTRLRSIPELPASMRELHVDGSTSLKTIFSLKAVFSLNRRQISFENCLRLDEESLNDVMEDARLTTFRNILLLSSQTLNLLDSDDENMRCEVCYPGSTVPEWFRFRTTEGASIRVEIDKPYHQLLGFFVSCAVSQEFSPYYSVHCEYDLGDGEKYPHGSYYSHRVDKRWDSDHVFLWFHPFYSCRILRAIERCIGSDDGSSTWNRTISFTFTAEGFRSTPEDFFIKGCGVFPIYASDVLDLIPKLQLELNLNPSHKSMVWEGLQDLDLHVLESKMVRKIKLEPFS
ncbi:disease resistance protein RPV1-like [Arachis stenosperma]|uniref:disease resistance protein RPV1-like n=1 Tax=Arachis stenosperma TaxID=217475 RepID=UPI0025AD1822|nr:disease resistance protein RPV1-like [Arachis stenosperma]